MSKLAIDLDDHPEAAGKHFEDARALYRASRFDGAAYLAGYVVECSLKTILLHDASYEPGTHAHEPTKLRAWHRKLRGKGFGHDLGRLLASAVGAEGARYLSAVEPEASVMGWTETMRYWAPSVSSEKATAYLSWADVAIGPVVRMRLDGVL